MNEEKSVQELRVIALELAVKSRPAGIAEHESYTIARAQAYERFLNTGTNTAKTE
jgi:hypothetical protein